MNWRKLSKILLAVAIIGSTGSIVARHYIRRERLTVLMTGRFHQVAHKGHGTAFVSQFPDGKRMLYLKEFSTGEGQDLAVYLIAAPDAFENETVEKSEFVPLGALQSSEGDQSYAVPAELDLNKYRAVTIWNRKYRVNYTTAPLTKVE
ncbi:MAG: DM13 domain-containing protein [Acidobacteria bacterium]|nr:DM13 domain-containing protein [Acidobacteriota bacterium]